MDNQEHSCSKSHSDAFRRMSAIGSAYASQRVRYLAELSKKSDDRFTPLSEPLTIGFGLNRWLSKDREEAYSDWLAWILRELKSAQSVKHILFGTDAKMSDFELSADYTVGREVWVPEGHEGHAGRLDCVIFGCNSIIVLELKKNDAEQADTAKHEGYLKWLKNRPEQEQNKKALLIASSNEDKAYYGFNLLRWEDLCKRARQMIPDLIAEQRLLLASLLCAFIGAIEQNLLELPPLDSLDNYRFFPTRDLETAIEYLEEFYI